MLFLYASINGGVNNTKYGRSSNKIVSIFLATTCASPTDFAALNSSARAKGLSQKRIRDRHAARTALLPVVTSFIFTIITIIDGSVLTESIFSWPGMGQLILEAVTREDIPLAMASFSFIGILALIAHFIADVSYAFLDPRIRVKADN